MPKHEPSRAPEMVARTQTLNVVFALSSVALLLAFSWMVWDDYHREWKKYQVEFNKLEVKLTETQIQEALGKVDAAKRDELQARLAQGEQEKTARRAEIRKAEGEIERLEAEWYRVDQDSRFTKAEIDVARFEYEEAAEHKAGSAARKKAHLDALEKRSSDLRVALEDVIARRDAAKGRLAELEKTKLEAEKT